MKKIIISATLKLIPKTFQNKALCKALNYICVEHDLDLLHKQTIKLNVSDLKKSWFVTYDESGFKATKSRKLDVEIKTKLNTAMNLQRKALILDAVKRGDIQFKGKASLIDSVNNLLCQLNEIRLANVSAHLFAFLKTESSQAARLDIHNVQLSDLASSLDVDFIRDEALKLEMTDLEKAFSLMLLAHQARPNGPFIAKKVEEYRVALKSH